MAASRAALSLPRIADLREIRGDDLDWILAHQSAYWEQRFRWDFASSREIIRRFLDTRRLQGYALVAADRPVGYCYFIPEDDKALIGDLFVAERYRDPASEAALLEPTLRAAALFPGVRRIEGQLLSLSTELEPCTVFSHPVRVYPRLYMVNDRIQPAADSPPAGFRVRRWSSADLDPSAELIAGAYRGHVDADINDQYRTAAGARRFLINTTQHAGSGDFTPRASCAAWRRDRLRMSGICLGAAIGRRVGHITQLCVAPEDRNQGLGRRLLTASMNGFRALGCDTVSLTVTANNSSAVRLYETMGFAVWRRFSAFVWEVSDS